MVLNLVNEGPDIDSRGACLLTWTIGAFHTAGCLCHSLLFSINSVMEIPHPIFIEIFLISFEFDFVLVSILLSILGADNLRGIYVRGGIS